MIKRILITIGEPAGIGPDITIQAVQRAWPCELVAIADPALLTARAKQLHLPLTLLDADLKAAPTPHQESTLKIIPQTLPDIVTPGMLNSDHARAVIQSLEKAATLCQAKVVDALVTAPVQKEIINAAGIAFTGHTEFFENYCHAKGTVMLFVLGKLKIALLTTHVPLALVSNTMTQERVEQAITILDQSLKQDFHISNPCILVCGINPHAGEGGWLGREEIEVLSPTLESLRKKGYSLQGPLAADTIFTKKQLELGDAVLAMYHDQALPLVKYIGFDQAVNVTLGLPFIRTSPDHGVALDIAGSGKADPSSMIKAIELAITMQQ